jgi:recombinational DNA repair protein (RecF pathway)
MKIERARAILLRRREYGEKDWIVTFLTDGGRKLSAFAAGAQKSLKRFGSSLDWFAHLEIEYTLPKPGNQLARLMTASRPDGEHINDLLLDGFAVASFFAEAILELLPDDLEMPEIYQHYKVVLDALRSKADINSVHVTGWLFSLLSFFGFQPDAELCQEVWSKIRHRTKFAEDPLVVLPFTSVMAEPGQLPEGIEQLGTFESEKLRHVLVYLLQSAAGKPFQTGHFFEVMGSQKIGSA